MFVACFLNKECMENNHCLPNVKQARTILNNIEYNSPVMHLNPTEHVVKSDNEYFLSQLINGKYTIKPNISQQGVLYYGNSGMTKCMTCLKAGYRLLFTNRDELMYNNVLLEQFALLIKSFPLFKLLNKGINIPELNISFSMPINPYALAPIYGLNSPFLNLTSSKDVAMFYATNVYDENEKRFKPSKKDSIGIIYVYNMEHSLGTMSELSVLGVQPFYRTLNSKTFSCVLRDGANFSNKNNVSTIIFTQDKKVSEYYLNMFDGGEKLRPYDDFLSLKWNNIKNDIYEKAIIENLKKNPYDDYDANIKTLQKRIGHNILKGSPSFTKEDLATVDLEILWHTMIEKISVLNDTDRKIKKYLERVPFIKEYIHYFQPN